MTELIPPVPEEKTFNVYDRVWMMKVNRPVERTIYSKTESMNFEKDGVEISYTVVVDQISAGVGNNKERGVSIERIFHSKQELLDSL